MQRRYFLQSGLVFLGANRLVAAIRDEQYDEACGVLQKRVDSGQLHGATLFVVRRGVTFSRAFGVASSANAMFLLGSITKPIAIMALMRLYDEGQFRLDDKLNRFIASFRGDGRERVTIRHLLTHISGLPDQLPENAALRAQHAPLSEFVSHAIRTPLLFSPGSQYEYSSMAILLASRVAELISGAGIQALVERTVLGPLEMQYSALGLGRFELADMISCQTDSAAPESGGGSLSAKSWDWNSLYWRSLGAPWGGGHASAPDVARFLLELMNEVGKVLKPETARLVKRNHNPEGFPARGLGIDVGISAGSLGCSERTFGHTGSTGTICWADPETEAVCVILTSLPARAVSPHPRDLAAASVSVAIVGR